MNRTTSPIVPRLRMVGVKKAFGATQALKNVTLEVAAGEVHALIGENGAGKSTLMKILSGAYRSDAGELQLNGQRFIPENPSHARRSGIAMIYQELTLAPHLSVEENIMLGLEPSRNGWIRRRERASRASRALAELHHTSIPLATPVHRLSIAEQQVVEIARALVGKPEVIIMDEPTSSLSQVDAENLFRVIGQLREGGVSVVYISHFLEECQRVCQRFTVLRDGETVGSGDMPTARLPDLIRLMVGREIQDIYPRRTPHFGSPVLELRALGGAIKPRSVSLSVRTGEIFGLAGLIGAGRTETLRSIFGLEVVRAGTVWLDERDQTQTTPAARLRQGVGLLSENRKEEGLMLNRSLADNLTLTRYGPLVRAGIIVPGRQRRCAEEWMRRLDVRARNSGQPIEELSGGNQQKIAIGRLLHHEARVLLLDEPTRGIDVGSKSQIYRLMGELAAAGKAVIFVSSYLPELMGVCDTIGVMSRGYLRAVRPTSDWTEHDIIEAAVEAAPSES